MGSTFEMVIVGVVVAAASIWALRAARRSVKEQGVCSSCGSSGDCPVGKNPEALAELGRKGKLDQPTDCRELAEVLEKDSLPENSSTSSN